jgi:hypothetical protein
MHGAKPFRLRYSSQNEQLSSTDMGSVLVSSLGHRPILNYHDMLPFFCDQTILEEMSEVVKASCSSKQVQVTLVVGQGVPVKTFGQRHAFLLWLW